MKRLITTFVTLTILFILLGFIVKSRYYYFPYPNLIEYLLASLLLTLAMFLMLWRSNIKAKFLIGLSAAVFLMGSINLLNIIFEWHPLDLNLPLIKSQSFEVDYEPYEWQSDLPAAFGYNNDSLSQYFDTLNKWERLRALLVVKDDKLIIEKYFSGATRYSAFNVHSITKSITSACIGVAIKHNFIPSEDAQVLSYFPEYDILPGDTLKKQLTIKHLLSMRGGWLGGDGHQTAKQCILDERISNVPGTDFRYFTGSHNILSAVITQSAKQSTQDFADQYLFNKLGIKTGFWRKADGYFCGGDESYYTARDLARFGNMYLHKGNVDGVQLLDSSWIEKSWMNYTENSREFRALDCYDEVGYGFSWWIFKIKDNEMIYAARGKGGQHIILIPSKNIVVVVWQEWNPLIKNINVENKLLGDLLRML